MLRLVSSLVFIAITIAPLSSTDASDSTAPVSASSSSDYQWRLPPGFPQPRVPDDNPMSEVKVELGRRLFYDPRLSSTGDLSCAGCHRQELGFTDGRKQAVGATGDVHRRNSMSLANVAYNLSLTWADPTIETLEEQLLTPLFGRHPIEMGLRREPADLAPLRADPQIGQLFRAAFPGDEEPLSFENLARAIAAFERTLLSGNSPFDQYWFQGHGDALTPSAQRGMGLFFSRRLSCSECHSRFNFSGPMRHEGSRPRIPELHNTGLYNLTDGAYPLSDQGLFEQTREPRDMGRFRPPTLRNIAVTAPYMHDGSITTLDEVIAHYAAGGRYLVDGPEAGPYAGTGHQNPWKSELLQGFELSAEETADLIAFLESLTDQTFLDEPHFGNPH